MARGWTGRAPRRAPMITESPPRTPVARCRPRRNRPAWYGVRLVRFVPDRAGFLDLARRGRLAFVYREVVADTDTPVSAYAKLGRGPYSFLLESVVGGDKWAAYSFVGVRPRAVDPRARLRRSRCCVRRRQRRLPRRRAGDGPSDAAAFRRRLPGEAGAGGAARGCRASSAARSGGWATTPCAASSGCRPPSRTTLGLPEVCFALTDTVVIFDNLRGTVKVVAAGRRRRDGHDPGRAYDDACARIDAVLERLARPAPPLRPLDPAPPAAAAAPARPSPGRRTRPACGASRSTSSPATRSRSSTRSASRSARGDVDPFDVYRALRVINPSPYMFHLEFPEAVVTGASPEVLVRLEGGEVEVRPIAGTRRAAPPPRRTPRWRPSCAPIRRSGRST